MRSIFSKSGLHAAPTSLLPLGGGEAWSGSRPSAEIKADDIAVVARFMTKQDMLHSPVDPAKLMLR